MPEQVKLRLGIMGTGNIARQFAAGLGTSSRCVAVAVGSRSESSAHAFAGEFRIPRIHASYDALCRDPEVEAVYVSLPNSMHHEWTICALRAGKHVLCEKPLAVTESQGREMFAAAQKAGRVLVEAFMYVSHPQTRALLEAVRGGVIGELRLIRTSFCYRTRRIDGNIRFSRDLCGGALMDVGCYCTSFARLLAGCEPDHVSGSARVHDAGVDIATIGLLRFPNGVLSTFSCAMDTQCDNTAHICGTEGYIQVAWPWKPSQQTAGYTIAHSIPPRQDKGGAGVQAAGQAVMLQTPGELYAIEADDFASTVLDGAPPAVSETDSLGNLRVLEAIRRQIGLRY